ncbi:unnamed protein product [Paramecium primaurelia]|uniref:Uncharacterized protein n=1 Tax=Paramecium primaurelia TaxID=5886 RepID=A0A8S1KKN8_PARPR|nr:unnamed protein product [Paramecium primaurelia]CAD8055650.1 unnamed protein product [Paramecium primaurelia]
MEKYFGKERKESNLKNIRSYTKGDAKEIKLKSFQLQGNTFRDNRPEQIIFINFDIKSEPNLIDSN